MTDHNTSWWPASPGYYPAPAECYFRFGIVTASYRQTPCMLPVSLSMHELTEILTMGSPSLMRFSTFSIFYIGTS